MLPKKCAGVEEEEEQFYSRHVRAYLIEEDELSNEEEGFMEGYDSETLDEDAYCKLDLEGNQEKK